MELLAPAGNYEKFETALRFGADAVYLAGKTFGLRAFAGNFETSEIFSACKQAHALGKKVYVTVNILAKDDDFKDLSDYLATLQQAEVDGLIISDIGIINFVRQHFPKLNIHVSTQANVTNLETAKFFASLGVKRIVLARELSLDEISKIAHALQGNVEIECFVHGAMCMSYSGRCLLSDYLTGRGANRGECVQACRWRYFIREQSRDDELELEEDERGTYILNSKDLCMIRHLKELQDAGVASLKIEGRMKSAYYVACVTRAYRKALDMLPKQAGEEFVTELEKTSHRRFTTGFYFDEKDRQFRESSTPVQTYEFVGVVLESDGKRVTASQRNYISAGDEVEVLSPDDKVHNKTFVIENMTDEGGASIQKANVAEMIFSFPCSLKLHKGDILRRKQK